jgi:hypothetical protein
MACPICGAKCRCRKRGEGGICCGCHRHKVNGLRLVIGSPEMDKWRVEHGYGPDEGRGEDAAVQSHSD